MEDCSPPKAAKRQRVSFRGSGTSPKHKEENPVIKQEVDLNSSVSDPVDDLGVDRCQNEYWYIPSMPHYLFVKSRVTNTWGLYKYSTQVRSGTLQCQPEGRMVVFAGTRSHLASTHTHMHTHTHTTHHTHTCTHTHTHLHTCTPAHTSLLYTHR